MGARTGLALHLVVEFKRHAAGDREKRSKAAKNAPDESRVGIASEEPQHQSGDRRDGNCDSGKKSEHAQRGPDPRPKRRE